MINFVIGIRNNNLPYLKLPIMKTRLFLTFISCIIAFVAVGGNVAVVPKPAVLIYNDGEYRFSPVTTYSVPDYPGDSVAMVMDMIKDDLQNGAGTTLSAVHDNAALSLRTDSTLASEGYALDVTPEGITIRAARPAGFFYALQSLRQLLPFSFTPSATAAVIPCVSMMDTPVSGWRGFMLDEGRHFFGKEEVKRVLDIMATYKMNRFHWHLADDQGWRIEIKKYPLLTEVGAWRGSKTLGWDKLKPDTLTYGGYYTQDDIREIVAYAADRFIEIVPEIDIPGHSMAAIAAYPDLLACDPENPHGVWVMQGISADVINVANPAAVQMTKDIIDELITLFPFRYIHLGGDECPTRKWETNELCKAQLDSLASENFRDLQLNFYRQLGEHIATKPEADRRRLIFWNEVLYGNPELLPDDITIMAWIAADRDARKAAERGFTTILTPQIPYYINRKQSSLDGEPLSQGAGRETLEAVYRYDPLRNVPAELHDRYLGIQGNMWTEYVYAPEHLEYLMLPRLAAIAETAWTPRELRDYADFRTRIRAQQPMLNTRGWNYCHHEFMNE